MAELFLFPRTRVASEKMIVLLKNLGENSKSTFEIHFSFFYSLRPGNSIANSQTHAKLNIVKHFSSQTRSNCVVVCRSVDSVGCPE